MLIVAAANSTQPLRASYLRLARCTVTASKDILCTVAVHSGLNYLQVQEDKLEKERAERERKLKQKQKAKDRVRTEKEKLAAEKEAAEKEARERSEEQNRLKEEQTLAARYR